MTLQAAKMGKPMEMENFFSRLTLDIIGKAVFNYDFDSLTNDDPVIQASTSKTNIITCCISNRSQMHDSIEYNAEIAKSLSCSSSCYRLVLLVC